MRYAIFSDIHANRQAWEAVREDARRQKADTLICLGDVIGYGPKPLEVLNAIREATPNFVLGNHDAAACGRLDASIFNDRARAVIEWTRERLDDEALEFLNQVPLQMNGEGILFVHAEVTEPGEFGYVDGPGPAASNLRSMTQPLAFIGHTHLPLAYTMPKRGGQVEQMPPLDFHVEGGKRTLVNVGSVGEPRTTDVRAGYVIYDAANRKVTFRKVAFDVEAYRRDLEEVGLDIHPYFIQVVEAGMASEAPSPAAAPQIAMSQLPRVVKGVTGKHGQLVLGGANHFTARVKQPRVMPTGVIALCAALVVLIVGGLVFIPNRKGNGEIAAIEQTPKITPDQDPKVVEPPTPEPMVATPAPKIPKPDTPPVEKPDPRPEPNTAPAPTLSQNLLAYWSFDSEKSQTSKFERRPDGLVLETFVAEKTQQVRALVPKRDLGTSWRRPDFNDSKWITGRNGAGYEDIPAEYKNLIQTVAGGTTKKHPHSIYVRIPFHVDNPAAYAGLVLYMKYDDGFAAFLNDKPMTSKNAPETLLWNSASTAPHPDPEAVMPELFKVSASLADLKKGWNVLAIQGLNVAGKPNATNTGSTSSDILVLPTLVALRKDKTMPKSDTEVDDRNMHDLVVAPERLKGKVKLSDGKFGEAHDYLGGNIDIGEAKRYSIGDHSFSVSLWCTLNRPKRDKQIRRFVSAGASDDEPGGWSVALRADTLMFGLCDGTDHSTTSAKVSGLANRKWHHVIATVDHPSGMVQIYLDGKRIADQRVTFVGRKTIPSESGLVIGGNSNPKQHHRGRIDEVAIWRRALVPEEVTRIFNGGKSLGTIFDDEETQ